MSLRDHARGTPAGYMLHESQLLVPNAIQAQTVKEEVFRPAEEPPKAAECPISTQPRPMAQPSKLVRIYSAAEVDRFEYCLVGLSRNSDRRRASEALLVDLRAQSPVGYREFVRVPRNFRQRMAVLEAEMPNFRQVIHQIRLLLTLQKAGQNMMKLPPLLLAGDPGVGKTFFATQFAKIMGVASHVLHMESVTSGMLLVGLEQHYATASPGMVFNTLVKGPHANPVLVLDELDKASSDARHPPANALLQLFEPNTASRFHDLSCLDVTLDASHINWIVTANDLEKIPLPLRTRMNVLHVPEPTRQERILIAGHVYRNMRRDEAWGHRFEASLPAKSAHLLADIPGSVRRMQSIMRMAFAYALDRKGRTVEARDLNEALMSELPVIDLEDIQPQGSA